MGMGTYTDSPLFFKTGSNPITVLALFAMVIALMISQGCVAQKTLTGKSSNYDPDLETLSRHIAFHRLDEAVSLADRVIVKNPNDAAGYYYRGMVWHLKGNYDQALKDLDHCISLKPDKAEYFSQRAFSHTKKHAYEKSLVDFTKSISLGQEATVHHYDRSGKPLLNSIYKERSDIYKILGQYDAALKDMNMAISRQPGNRGYYLYRAEIYIFLAQLDKAMNDAKKSAELDPSFPSAQNMMGMIRFLGGNFLQAIAYLDKAIELSGKDPETNAIQTAAFYGNRGIFKWQAGMKNQAIDDAKKSVSRQGQDADPGMLSHFYFHLAYFMHEIGETGQAKAYFKRSLDLYPGIIARRNKVLEPRYALYPGNFKFFRAESEAALTYLNPGTTKPLPVGNPEMPLKANLEITQVKVMPEQILKGAPFDIHITYTLMDPDIQNPPEQITFLFEILKDSQPLFKSSPIVIGPATPGTGSWVQHMNPSTLKGVFSVRATLEYKKLFSEKTTGFMIE